MENIFETIDNLAPLELAYTWQAFAELEAWGEGWELSDWMAQENSRIDIWRNSVRHTLKAEYSESAAYAGFPTTAHNVRRAIEMGRQKAAGS